MFWSMLNTYLVNDVMVKSTWIFIVSLQLVVLNITVLHYRLTVKIIHRKPFNLTHDTRDFLTLPVFLRAKHGKSCSITLSFFAAATKTNKQ